MPEANADHALLLGLLANRLDFVSEEGLVRALRVWARDRARPIGEVLVELGLLTPERRALFESLVREHLSVHGGDLQQSLTALSPPRALLDATGAGAQPGPRRDLYETQAPTPLQGPPSSGLYETRAPEPAPAQSPDTTSAHVSLGGPLSAGQSGSFPQTAPRFRVVREHARGGLGEVLVADDQELHREVALKQIQDRFADDRESRLRFLLEAEITGGLEHPGIVPVYSLGTYPDGRPYYAMRFIRGNSLKEAIDCYFVAEDSLTPEARMLGLRQLLTRFMAVCNAIAYAHSRGVLHRDIKPANVMLGAYGETLVVDWGLAKPLGQGDIKSSSPEGALSPTMASVSLPTMMGSTVGTPHFMSPEQAAGRVDELGTASDIYSLGATLYYLLTGRPAADGPDLPTVLKMVQTGDIPSPRQVRPSVPQPLEAICLKAMALAPEGRYDTALRLADDIEKWLADEPVSAWREPWPVRAQRWINRNRTLVTSAASAMLVALIGLSTATVLLQAANDRERAARALASEQRDRAEENYRLARQAVDRYHTNVSEDVLLNEPGMEPLRKRLLEDAREFYATFVRGHEDDPAVRGEMGKALFRLAQITGDIDSPHKAIELLTKAREAFAELAEDEPDVAEYRADLAACDHHLGRLYRLTDHLGRAEKFGSWAVTGWETLLRDHPNTPKYIAELARSRNVLANVYQVRRMLNRAVATDKLALADWERLVAGDRANAEYRRYLALSHNHLGMVYNDIGDVKKAEKEFGLSLAVRKELVSEYPNVSQYRNDLASSHFNLGDLYTQAGRRDRAKGPFEEAAALWKALANQHPAVARFQVNLAEAHSVLVGTYLAANDAGKAEATAVEALAIRQKLVDAQPSVPAYQSALADAHFRLGDVYRRRRQGEKAEAEYREALRLQEQLVRDHRAIPLYRADAARTHNNLGLFYLGAKQWEKSEASFRVALPHWEALTKEHPREVEYALGLSATCYNLGNIRADNDKAGDALSWYDRALAALEGRFRPEMYSPAIKRALSDARKERAEALTRLGRHKEALADWGRAIALAAPANRPWFNLYRTRAVALSGDHVGAVAVVAEIAPKASRNGEVSFLLAGVCALSSAAAAKDEKLSPDERRAAAERYAVRAVELLGRARTSNFFRVPANVARLAEGADFAAIRGRPEVAALLKEVRPKGGP
jgi:serine/threonine-protein kinase